MKENANMIEQRLKRAVEQSTPDVLPEILLRLRQEGDTAATNTAIEPTTALVEYKEITPKKRGRVSWLRWAGSVAAALVVAVGIYFGYGYVTPESTISFDVNPSVELRVNRSERVLEAVARNEDAQVILSDMNLRNVDLDVAVNALIGSMVKNGYISEIKNSILISVDSRNSEKGRRLQQRLSGEVGALLDAYSVSGAVLSQTVSEDERLGALAEQHGISLGKAALVDLLVGEDPLLRFEDVAALPINDINLLIAAKQTDLQGVAASGQASSGAYIGEAAAKAAALKHAGVREADVTYSKIELDYDDGRMVYEIEFDTASVEYDYEIDAATGEIVEYDHDGKKQPVQQPSPPAEESSKPAAETSAGSAAYIGEAKAKSIALEHAGVSERDVRIVKNVRYEKQGVMRYDVIFLSAATKYSYEINAKTGEVIAYYTHALNGGNRDDDDDDDYDDDSDDDDDDDRRDNETGDVIGEARAKSIALSHAGASADLVRKLEIKLDEDDDRLVYEIEFVYDGTEYEYEIDAYSGEILYWDSEED